MSDSRQIEIDNPDFLEFSEQEMLMLQHTQHTLPDNFDLSDVEKFLLGSSSSSNTTVQTVSIDQSSSSSSNTTVQTVSIDQPQCTCSQHMPPNRQNFCIFSSNKRKVNIGVSAYQYKIRGFEKIPQEEEPVQINLETDKEFTANIVSVIKSKETKSLEEACNALKIPSQRLVSILNASNKTYASLKMEDVSDDQFVQIYRTNHKDIKKTAKILGLTTPQFLNYIAKYRPHLTEPLNLVISNNNRTCKKR